MSYKNKNYDRARLHIDQALNIAGRNDELISKIQRIVFEIDLSDRKYDNCRITYQEIVTRNQQDEIRKIEEKIEQHWQQLNDENRKQYSECFQNVPGLYGFLNRVRLRTEKISRDEWLAVLDAMDNNLNQLPIYYAYLVLYLMEDYPQDVWRLSSRFSEQTVVDYMAYLDESDKTLFVRICRNFIRCLPIHETNLYQMSRIQKNMAKYLLFSGVLDTTEYEDIFLFYIEKGKLYLETLYNPILFEQELACDLKNREEMFIMYMVLADRFTQDGSTRIQYLKKALTVYPEMSKGVEIALQSLAQQENNKELESLIEKLLSIVEDHIVKKEFDDALNIVLECEGIIGQNLQLLAKKSEIYQKKYEN